MQVIYYKPTANIILKGEKWKAFPLRWGTRQGWPLSPLLLGVLTPTISQEKETKDIPIGKEKIKFSLSANDTTLYVENPKDTTKLPLELSVFKKLQDTKVIDRNLLHFYIHNKLWWKRNGGNNPIYNCIKKNKTLRNKSKFYRFSIKKI